MKVLEVKNNLVKIEYTPQDNLLLSGFVIIEDSQSPYVAQVLSLKADNGINYAIVKLLFTFNDEGIVKNYDGTIPSLDADVSRLGSDELLDILPVNTPLEVGTIAHQGINLKVDMSIFEKNLLICADNTEDSNILLENFVYQLTENNCKTIVFDTDGYFSGEKLTFGVDFKLPLNYETINYIYDHDLGNVDPASKAIIQEIFLEVQEYSKTVLDKFIPFDTFMGVVEQQYRISGIPELILLKNKLLKYKEMNVFAQSPKEIHNLKSAIRANLSNTIDISTVDDNLQGEIIKYVYDTIDEMDLFVYSFVQVNNGNADKKLIRHFFAKNKIYTSVVASHNFKYLFELKERASNLILFAPQVMQHDFSAYNTFLNKLNPDEFIIYGKATQNIPLIVELASMFDEPEPEQTPLNSVNAEQNSVEENHESSNDDFSEESNSYSYETLIKDTTPQPEEPEKEPEPEALAATEQSVETPAQPETSDVEENQAADDEIDEEIEVDEGDYEYEEDDESSEDVVSEDAPEENSAAETEEIPSNEQSETSEETEDSETQEEEEPSDDSEIDTEEDEIDEESEVEDVDTETISNIIDKEIEAEIYTDPYGDNVIEGEFEEIDDNPPALESSIEESGAELPDVTQNVELPELEENSPVNEGELLPAGETVPFTSTEGIESSEEELTEDDLNFIQGVNSPVEEGGLPVYPAEDLTGGSDVPVFEAGDHVSHPKYGEGIVEKMIRYGNKSLCSISFVNVGRRLLDPAISEITKL